MTFILWVSSILGLAPSYLSGCVTSPTGGFIFSNLVAGHRWYVAIHVPGPQATLWQIPVCMLVRLVDHGTSLASVS
jgi:hypothetical protein